MFCNNLYVIMFFRSDIRFLVRIILDKLHLGYKGQGASDHPSVKVPSKQIKINDSLHNRKPSAPSTCQRYEDYYFKVCHLPQNCFFCTFYSCDTAFFCCFLPSTFFSLNGFVSCYPYIFPDL